MTILLLKEVLISESKQILKLRWKKGMDEYTSFKANGGTIDVFSQLVKDHRNAKAKTWKRAYYFLTS
jgi:hypothetical protein